MFAIVGSKYIVWFIKNLVQRPRPPQALITESGFSFPSGHAFVAIVFYGFLLYLIINFFENKTIRKLAIFFIPLIILAIGYSRIYLGVHWYSDVLAGYFFGVIWLLIVIFILEKIKKIRIKL